MVVDRRLRAGGNDQREQGQRAVLGAVERVLPDAAAHAARQIRRGVLLRQPSRGGQQFREGRLQRLDARWRCPASRPSAAASRRSARGSPARRRGSRNAATWMQGSRDASWCVLAEIAHARIVAPATWGERGADGPPSRTMPGRTGRGHLTGLCSGMRVRLTAARRRRSRRSSARSRTACPGAGRSSGHTSPRRGVPTSPTRLPVFLSIANSFGWLSAVCPVASSSVEVAAIAA